jgi:hypothetical protein
MSQLRSTPVFRLTLSKNQGAWPALVLLIAGKQATGDIYGLAKQVKRKGSVIPQNHFGSSVNRDKAMVNRSFKTISYLDFQKINYLQPADWGLFFLPLGHFVLAGRGQLADIGAIVIDRV